MSWLTFERRADFLGKCSFSNISENRPINFLWLLGESDSKRTWCGGHIRVFFLFLRFWFGTWISNTIHRFAIASPYTYVRTTMFSIFYRLRVFLLLYTYFLRKLIWQDYKTSRFLQAKQVDIWSLRIHSLKVCFPLALLTIRVIT